MVAGLTVACGGVVMMAVCRIQCLDRSPQYRQRSNHTVQVEVAVALISVSSLSLARMEVSLELHLTQTWADPRCRFRSLAGWEDTVTLQGAGLQHRCPPCSGVPPAVYDADPTARLEHLWLPDTVITTAVQSTARPQQTTRLHYTGTISHRTRLSVVAACPMNLHLFPFDRWQHQSLAPSLCHLQPAVRAGAAELLLPHGQGGLQVAGRGPPVPG